MRQRMRLLLILALALACSAAVSAAPPLRVGLGVSDQVYKNPTAQAGYEMLLLNELMQTLQLPHQIIRAPHARLRQMLADGELDLAVRQQQPALAGIYLSIPYARIKNKAFALADFRGRPRTTADLAKFRLTAFQNATGVLGPIYAAATSRAPEYRELSDHTQAVLMLLKHRTELLVINEKTLENVLSTLGQSRDSLREFDLFTLTEFHLGGHDPALIARFDALLTLWQHNGMLLQLRQRGQSLSHNSPMSPPAKQPHD